MSLSPLAELPALPLHEAGKYVAGAYVVLFALVLIYVAIMAIRMSRLERELGEVLGSAQDRDARESALQERLAQAHASTGSPGAEDRQRAAGGLDGQMTAGAQVPAQEAEEP